MVVVCAVGLRPVGHRPHLMQCQEVKRGRRPSGNRRFCSRVPLGDLDVSSGVIYAPEDTSKDSAPGMTGYPVRAYGVKRDGGGCAAVPGSS